jgi:hypothetical protein
MFSSPPEENGQPDGMHDEQPIRLPETTVEEFEALLDYFYSL